MEAHANLIADYFLLQFRQGKRELSQTRYACMRGDPKPMYQATLRDVIRNPGDQRNLPKVTE